MTGIKDKVKDAVGLGSHDSKESSSVTGTNTTHTNTASHTSDNTPMENAKLQPELGAGQGSAAGRKFSDAAQMPPSAFKQQVGEPSIEHDYPHDAASKRHSTSHQENHFMG